MRTPAERRRAALHKSTQPQKLAGPPRRGAHRQGSGVSGRLRTPVKSTTRPFLYFAWGGMGPSWLGTGPQAASSDAVAGAAPHHTLTLGRRRARAPRRDGALVGQVAADAALVLLLGAPDERGVEDQAVLGRVALGLQRPARPALSARSPPGWRARLAVRTPRARVLIGTRAPCLAASQSA